MTVEIMDVAIVGGGVSGVYTGWRLLRANLENSSVLGSLAQQRNGRLDVRMFELGERIGGRLLSLTPPEISGFKAELGGMRFLTSQHLVRSLVQHLGLATKPFAVSGPENIYYLRGHHLRQRDFAQFGSVPYRLSWLEQGKGPGQLIADAIDVIVPGALHLSDKEWRQVKANYRFHGRHLYDLGFWNVLHKVMSSEAYKLVLDAGGYITTLSNWNAAEAMHWYLADFGPEAQYIGIVDGYQQLPLTLAEQFQEDGGQIHLCRRLTSFDQVTSDEGEPLLRLHFAGEPPRYARHLVLAMPRRSLELLEQDTDFFHHPQVKSLVPTVTPHPMFKLFLCYRYPWWKDAGVNLGRSVTDLPLRQVYYFGSEAEGPTAYNPELRDSLVMASYDDGLFVGFWQGLMGEQADRDCEPQTETAGAWSHYEAPPAMIEHAQRQLKLVHDLEYIPDPYASAFIYWGRDPFGGAWNSWNIHVKAWEVMEKIVQPLPEWPVYVCGEAYSGAQGWVEGALQTAERLLTEKLDLHVPPWFSTD